MRDADPFGWLEKYFSANTLHLIINAVAVVVILVFLIHRVSLYSRYLFKPLWAAETLIFVVFMISYIVRINPADRSRGFQEILIPLAGAMLPFALIFSPSQSLITGQTTYAYIVFIWMTVSTVLTVWGLWTLRRSFSITVEARELVTGGPYRFIRHPVYLGEMLSAAAVTIFRFSPVNVLILFLFVAIQLFRSKMEENKLGRVLPGYIDFAAKAFWFWPGPPKNQS